MKLTTINIHGIADQLNKNRDKINGIISYIKKAKLDIVCFQETHLNSDLEVSNIFKDLNGDIYFSNSTNSRSCGVAIWVSNPEQLKIIAHASDDAGRVISILIEVNNKLILNIVNIYAPNQPRERMKFIDTISQYIFKNPDGSLRGEPIILGDFNNIENIDLDKNGASWGGATSGHQQITNLKQEYNLHDIFRELNPNIRKYTFYCNRYNSSSRIDRIYGTTNFKSLVTKCDISRCPQSDHEYVCCSFHTDNAQRGPGVWKINNSILQDQAFRDKFVNFWNHWQQQKADYGDIQTWWDLGKIKIKSLCREYCQEKRANEDQLLSSLREEYSDHLDQLDQYPDGGVPGERLEYLRTEIARLEAQKMEGIIIRSRIQYREEGEKCTKFFVDLEKQKAINKTIDSLRTNEGEVVTEPEDILNEQIKFYAELYAEEGVDPLAQDILLNNIGVKLSLNDANKCEGRLNLEEATKAIKAFKSGRSPGHDGLSAEFYKCFWDTLGPDFIEVANAAFETGLLSVSQRRGMIVLLFKKGDKLSLKNWRPISLLNIDYKIITKCLANRLRQVLHKIIHPDQTCSVPGRSIQQTTSFIRDLIDYVNTKNVPAALICIDQMKAFDRVNWSFLFKTLQKFGFGPHFIDWVKLCYTDISSAMHTNGFLSLFFKLQRGTRQGCPLSALLYVLMAEVFAINVRQEKKIHGITLPDGTITKIDQYADDTTIQICDTDSIESVFSLIRVYESASGCRINMDKTEGLWLGSFRGRGDKPMDLRWSSNSVKVLGFHLGNVDTSHENWRPRIDKFKSILRLWNRRQLTLKGRIVVLNSLASAGIWYYSNILSMPAWAESEIKHESLEFLWRYKKHLVNACAMKQKLDEGGLNLIDIPIKVKAQRIKYISRLFLPCGSVKWKALADYFIGLYRGVSLGRTILTSCIFPYAGNIVQMPQIYKECIKAWTLADVIGECQPTTKEVLADTPVFLNRALTIADDIPLFNTTFINKGVKTIGDLIADGEFMSPQKCLSQYSIEPSIANRTYIRALLYCIPPNWLRVINNDQADYKPGDHVGIVDQGQKGRFLTVAKFTTRKLCYILKQVANPAANISSLRRWQAIFHNNNLSAKHIFTGIHTNNLCNTASDLQWKSVHMVLPTNKFLYQCTIIASAECSLCNHPEENILHAFTTCPNATIFWGQVRPIFASLVSHGGNPLGLFNICFGFSHLHKHMDEHTISLANYMLFTAKHSIWVARGLKRDGKRADPYPIFKNKIKTRISEEYVHSSEQTPPRLAAFNKRWCSGQAVCWLDGQNLLHYNF